MGFSARGSCDMRLDFQGLVLLHESFDNADFEILGLRSSHIDGFRDGERRADASACQIAGSKENDCLTAVGRQLERASAKVSAVAKRPRRQLRSGRKERGLREVG